MAKTDNTNPRSYKRTVDWGAIGKQFTDAIVDTKTKQTETAKKGFEAQKERAKVKRERAERREVFEDEAVEFEKLQRANQRAIQTNTKSRNDITLAVTSQGVDKYNELFQEFKSGKISEREFLRSRQNLKDGFSNYFRIAKEYNDMKANAEKSIAEGGSKTITDFMLGQLESLQNTEELEVSFTDKGQWNVSYLDGVTFSALDGFVKTKNTMPIETFGVIGRVNYSGFDADATATNIASRFGGYVTQRGRVFKSDPKLAKNYKENINIQLEQALDNPGQLASYLLDNIDVDENGEPFELTFDPKVAATNKNYILVTIDNNDSVPTFQVSDEAKDYAKQQLQQQVEARFTVQTKISPKQRTPPPPEVKLPNDQVESELKKVVKTSKRIIKEIQGKPQYKVFPLSNEDRLEVEKQEQYIANAETILSNKTWTNADFVREENKADGKIIGVEIGGTGTGSKYNKQQ